MITKYDVGDIIPIGFEIKSIDISSNGVNYHLETKNRYLGGVIHLNFVSEKEIDKELEHENEI